MFNKTHVKKAGKVTLLSSLCAVACLVAPWLFAEEPSTTVAVQTAVAAMPQFTQEIADTIINTRIALDTVWVLFAGFLVFFMNLGFGMVEAGLCRSKNAVNIFERYYFIWILFCNHKGS